MINATPSDASLGSEHIQGQSDALDLSKLFDPNTVIVSVPASYSAIIEVNKSQTIQFLPPSDVQLSNNLTYLGFANQKSLKHPDELNKSDLLTEYQFVTFTLSDNSYSYTPSEAGAFVFVFIWKMNGIYYLTGPLQLTVAVIKGEIKPSIVPSRISGVAPLAVQFDASQTTSPSTPRPFHDLSFAWDFNDPNSGTWATDGLSKNTAKGPISAHVFEHPGTYTVTLSVGDGVGNQALTHVDILVEDPDKVFQGEDTICVSTTGTFTGCPADSLHVTTSTWETARTYLDTQKRLLFRRGESWSFHDSFKFNRSGPGIIGAFGEGDSPRFVCQTNEFARFMRLSDKTHLLTDWRFMDLEIDGANGADVGAFSSSGLTKNITFLRLNLHHLKSTFILHYQKELKQGQNDVAIVDSKLTFPTNDQTSGGTGGVLISVSRLIFMGNEVNNLSPNGVPYGHVFRLAYVSHGVVQHSRLEHAGIGKDVLKLHAFCDEIHLENEPNECWTSPENQPFFTSQYSVISDNFFKAGTDSSWTLGLAPENNNFDQHLKHFIVERNFFTSEGGSGRVAYVSAQDVTLRNNIFHMSNITYNDPTGIAIEHRGGLGSPGLTPLRVHVFNNTFYSSASPQGPQQFFGIKVEEGSEESTIFNNLVSFPNAGPQGHLLSDDGVVTNTLCPNNPDCNLLLEDGGFIAVDPKAPLDFQLNATSKAIDKGENLSSVIEDFTGTPRPQMNSSDVGAMEFH